MFDARTDTKNGIHGIRHDRCDVGSIGSRRKRSNTRNHVRGRIGRAAAPKALRATAGNDCKFAGHRP